MIVFLGSGLFLTDPHTECRVLGRSQLYVGLCCKTPHPGQAWTWMPSITRESHVCLAHQMSSGQLFPLWVPLSLHLRLLTSVYPGELISACESLSLTRDHTSSCPRTEDRIRILKVGFFWEAWVSWLQGPSSLDWFLTLLHPVPL